jgi:hypothetical protein
MVLKNQQSRQPIVDATPVSSAKRSAWRDTDRIGILPSKRAVGA